MAGQRSCERQCWQRGSPSRSELSWSIGQNPCTQVPLRLLELSDVPNRIRHLLPFPSSTLPPTAATSTAPLPPLLPSEHPRLLWSLSQRMLPLTTQTKAQPFLSVPQNPLHHDTNHFTVSMHAPISVFPPNHEILETISFLTAISKWSTCLAHPRHQIKIL